MVFVFESHESLRCRHGAHVDEPPSMAVWVDKAIRIHESKVLRFVGRSSSSDREVDEYLFAHGFLLCVVGYDDVRCGLTLCRSAAASALHHSPKTNDLAREAVGWSGGGGRAACGHVIGASHVNV